MDEIVTRNAKLAISRRFGGYKDVPPCPCDPCKAYPGTPKGLARAAKDMAQRMPLDIKPGESPEKADARRQYKADKQLRRMLALDSDHLDDPVKNLKSLWTVDYLVYFSGAISWTEARLMATNADNPDAKLSEADYAAFLGELIGKTITVANARKLREALKRQTQTNGMFDLILEISDALTGTPAQRVGRKIIRPVQAPSDLDTAQRKVARLIDRSGIFPDEAAKPARSPRTDWAAQASGEKDD